MSELKLGKILNGTEQRDAFHVAVAPVAASQVLPIGEHVGLLPDGTASRSADAIGIVDPFLERPVKKGERFYLWLYPNTVTGMRHHWEHPAFVEQQQSTLPTSGKDLSVSEQWLRDYADSIDQSYESLMEVAAGYLSHSEYLCEGDRYEGVYTPDEFWTHYEAVTGTKVGDNERGSFFSCSC
jgi:hypothetical protein